MFTSESNMYHKLLILLEIGNESKVIYLAIDYTYILYFSKFLT